MVAVQTTVLYSKKVWRKAILFYLNFPFDLRQKIMYLCAAFYAEYTAYAHNFCYVLLAHFSAKLQTEFS